MSIGEERVSAYGTGVTPPFSLSDALKVPRFHEFHGFTSFTSWHGCPGKHEVRVALSGAEEDGELHGYRL
ncbi:MAG TPA: hypothetical protein VLA19_29920 [Herpetosiphonaceae bacterium]|nr:hypothetical protein [Herpetosiphonaceae bacterium]